MASLMNNRKTHLQKMTSTHKESIKKRKKREKKEHSKPQFFYKKRGLADPKLIYEYIVEIRRKEKGEDKRGIPRNNNNKNDRRRRRKEKEQEL